MASSPSNDNQPLGGERDSRIALDGDSFVPSHSIHIELGDLGFTQGVTAVERLRAYNGRLFQLDRHLDRFARTTTELRISGLPDRQALSDRLHQLITQNESWIDTQDDFGVTLLATPGKNRDENSNSSRLIMDLFPIHAAANRRWIEQGTPLVVTEVQQPPNESWSRQIKIRCRVHYYLADQQAISVVPDSHGILVDHDGTITETSIANLLIVENGALISPQREQILDGVSLQVVRELASELDIPFRHERISAERLTAADEVLQTGTRCGIWFAHSINGSDQRDPGPVYRRLRNAFDHLTEPLKGR